MSYLEEIARSALNTAHSDLLKAHRALLLVAGLLALIHLLTVQPYILVSRGIAGIQSQLDSADALLARLNPEIELLQTAEMESREQITEILDRTTKRMREITETASAPAAAIEGIRQRQEDLRSALMEQRETLESQFQAQSKQLTNLSGTSGAIPVDLSTFIGVFPLVTGLAFGLLLLRVGQARHDAARSALELAVAAPEDYDTRQVGNPLPTKVPRSTTSVDMGCHAYLLINHIFYFLGNLYFPWA
jgi:hypothetical protein